MTDLREAMQRTAGANDLIAVDVPEWERKVYIRKLTVRDQSIIDEKSQTPVETSLRILLASIVDENGERQLTDDDLDLLRDQPFPVIIPLLTEAARANGLNSAELEEAVALFKTSPGADRSTE